MKILHITPTLSPAVGGIETVVRDLMRESRRRGIEADALHIAPGHRRLTSDTLDASTVWRVPLFPNRVIGLMPGMRRVLSGYDLLHVHDPQLMAISANVLWQAPRQRKVLSTHGGYGHTQTYSWGKALHWRWAAAPLLRRYDRVLASSQADYERFHTLADHVRLVPNGVTVDRPFRVDPSRPPDPRRWIYWGRLSRNKRLDLLVDLVARLRERGVLVDLHIAGQDFDGLAPALESQIRRHSLTAQVRLAGALSEAELAREIAARSVFVTASEHEGFGLSVVEAMAAGMIVICRDMPPLNGFVTQGENGVLLGFEDPAADLARLQALCALPGPVLTRMSENARLAARAHSWETVMEQYIRTYEEVMAGS